MRLVIAEKSSVAESIADVLGVKTKNKGYFENNEYIITWCVGHLVALANPEAYGEKYAERPWKFENLPILPENWKFIVNPSTKVQFNVIKTLSARSDVTELICATDAGREGECIFRYVYNKIGCKKPVKRLWTSSLEKSAIEDGFKNLKNDTDFDNLYRAGLARAKADWLVGINGTRLFSVRYNTFLSIGRVQTPTLAFIVDRYYKVKNFIKEKFFTVDINLGDFTASTDRIDDISVAKSKCENAIAGTPTVTSVTKEFKTNNPPKLYDLTTLQREANRKFGYSAQQTLDSVQSLYEKKLSTYPRTDSQYITDDMESTASNVINCIYDVYTQFEPNINPNIKRCINNKKVSDHHALLPTVEIRNYDLSTLPTQEYNVLFLIATRLLCATAEPHKYEMVNIKLKSGDCVFSGSSKKILINGWKSLIESESDVIPLQEFFEGQQFADNQYDINVSEHFTTPPKNYTDDTLLSAMETAGNKDYDENSDVEKKGIGTPATRAGIIENLVNRAYVTREKKSIIPTDKGINLIETVADELKSAKMTAEWETTLQTIERGQSSDTDFINHITSFVNELMTKYAVEDNSNKFAVKNVSLGKCPKCSNDVIKGKYGYYCTGKCGMNIGKVYGKELTVSQLTNLLSGKNISFTSKGKKTTVYPKVEAYEYNGKKGYQWMIKRG
jgi:DNA topoisomerase-3